MIWWEGWNPAELKNNPHEDEKKIILPQCSPRLPPHRPWYSQPFWVCKVWIMKMRIFLGVLLTCNPNKEIKLYQSPSSLRIAEDRYDLGAGRGQKAQVLSFIDLLVTSPLHAGDHDQVSPKLKRFWPGAGSVAKMAANAAAVAGVASCCERAMIAMMINSLHKWQLSAAHILNKHFWKKALAPDNLLHWKYH